MSKRADAANAAFRKQIDKFVMSLSAGSLLHMFGYSGVTAGLGPVRNVSATRKGSGRRAAHRANRTGAKLSRRLERHGDLYRSSSVVSDAFKQIQRAQWLLEREKRMVGSIADRIAENRAKTRLATLNEAHNVKLDEL